MAVPLNEINNKGVRATNAGNLPRACIRDGRPPEMFIVKQVKGGPAWLEVFCHQCFNLELDDIFLNNSNKKERSLLGRR